MKEKIKDLSVTEIISTLEKFCSLSGINDADDMEMISSALKDVKGGLWTETFRKILNNYNTGLIEVKYPPKKLSLKFITTIINQYMQTAKKKEEPEIEPEKPSPERIDQIMTDGNKLTLIQYYKTFYQDDPRLIHIFMLTNKYDWLLEKGKITQDWIDNLDLLDIEEKKRELINYQLNTRKILKIEMSAESQNKASIVAIYYDLLIKEHPEISERDENYINELIEKLK